MFIHLRRVIFTLGFMGLISFHLRAQEDSGWRISPEKINIQIGTDRPLQLLDDSAQELHGALWSVDNPELAEIQEEDGQVVLRAKVAGTVRVSAALGGEMRSREIKVWPSIFSLPPGTTRWGLHPIGREIGDIAAAPTGFGPEIFSLEQTIGGGTYLRADRNDGIQVWTWLMPETNHDVELVCGDWFGGALISSNHPDSYTLYAVGKDGKLRWQHTATGLRKGLAISLDHLVYLLSQSADGNAASLEGLDELSGAKKFAHPIPASTERQASVRKEGAGFVCTSGIISGRSRTTTSRVIVNMDGFAYLAFTQNTRTLGTAKCVLGSTVDPSQMYLARDESLRLWQIHPDGTYRSTVVEAMRGKQSLTAPVSTVSPLTSIVTDNMNGILLPVQMSSSAGSASGSDTTGEVIYRIDPNGEVVYKFPLPKYAGPMHDEMVIGEDDVAFATRGGILIAFNLRVGREIWRWDSNTPEISVFAALANGDCIVQTPKGLVEVESATRSKEVMGGKVMMDWQGQMYRKHN